MIFCLQTLLIKSAVYFALSVDLEVPSFYRLREKPGFLHSKRLSHRRDRRFVRLQGIYINFYSVSHTRSSFRSDAVVAVVLSLLLRLLLLVAVQLLLK